MRELSNPGSPPQVGGGWRREPARPEWLRSRPNAPYYALGAVCIGAFMGQLDASIVTVAFPTLQRSFHESLGAVTWVGLSYLVVLIGCVTAFGHLADMIGRKLLYTYGFVVFILGSAGAAFAPTLWALDGLRVLQAVGAAMLQANSVAIIYLAMPKERRARAIGIQGAAQAVGLALGPSVGGLLLAAGSWRLIFLVNVPAGILGTVAAWLFIPRSRDLEPRTADDWSGLALFGAAVLATLVLLTFGPSIGWGSARAVALLLVTLGAGVGFVVRERRAASPMMDLALFARPAFRRGIGGGLISSMMLFGTMFAVPFYLERARSIPPARAGLELTLLPVALGIAAPLAGRLSERVGAKALTGTGMALGATALALLGLARPAGVLLALLLGLLGVGLGLFIAPNTASVMAGAPRAQAGVASGVLNMTRGLGTALGLSLTSLVLSSDATGRSGVASGGAFTMALCSLAALGACAALLTRSEKAESDQ